MKVLITGGAGFIGSNLADFLLSKGESVTIYDNLSREKVKNNIRWLKENRGSSKLEVIIDDIRNKDSLNSAIKNKDVIFHLAAQVAVTNSIKRPNEDFEVNTIGTINILEGIRKYNPEALAIYSSTNKVYGSMENLKIGQNGVNESFPLDFHSPYACSKGAADLYFYDYGRIYGLKTVIFRQSCIYGNRQFGNEDQGWVMHFLNKFLRGENINIYGNGGQVRDILYIDDLIGAYMLAINKQSFSTNKIDKSVGNIYNIGGGIKNKVSLIKFIKILETKFNKPAKLTFYKPRLGDQKVFFSDNRKVNKDLGWKAKVEITDGIDKLYDWVLQIK